MERDMFNKYRMKNVVIKLKSFFINVIMKEDVEKMMMWDI